MLRAERRGLLYNATAMLIDSPLLCTGTPDWRSERYDSCQSLNHGARAFVLPHGLPRMCLRGARPRVPTFVMGPSVDRLSPSGDYLQLRRAFGEESTSHVVCLDAVTTHGQSLASACSLSLVAWLNAHVGANVTRLTAIGSLGESAIVNTVIGLVNRFAPRTMCESYCIAQFPSPTLRVRIGCA